MRLRRPGPDYGGAELKAETEDRTRKAETELRTRAEIRRPRPMLRSSAWEMGSEAFRYR